MNILHATTDLTLLQRLKQMLGSAARADIAVSYLFVSGVNAVAGELARPEKIRRLEALRERHRLDPAEQAVRIVCSGGLLPAP